MEVILEFIAMVVSLIFEVTIHALTFICLIVMSIFSQRYRQRLKEDWATAGRKRYLIALGICFYSIALAIALVVWVPVIRAGDKLTDSAREDSPVDDVFSSEEDEKLDKEKVEKVIKVAGDFIKRRLEKKREEEGAGEEKLESSDP